MCGIAGVFAYQPAARAVVRDELIAIRDHMAARGPDGAGLWLAEDARVGFGHRRLSIIDLSDRALQPMRSADGRYTIVFNGEIYNYKHLRAWLDTRGVVARTSSDTEVILQLYAERGVGMLNDLRGMFALAIWDADARRLMLARDGYGIKPLYYANDGWTLRFASQVKALLSAKAVSREPNPDGWAGFYMFGYVPDPITTYREIRAVPAGTYMIVDRSGPREPVRFYSVPETIRTAEQRPRVSAEAAKGALRSALLDSIRHHMVADVSVGAFLSAGIDSGAIVGLMRDAGASAIETITLKFGEFAASDKDEAAGAAAVARQYGTRHTTRVVTRAECERDLPAILAAMDQPSIDGLNTWFVSKAARELGLKVAMSGLGGDELFGGYPSFEDVPRWVRWLAVPSRLPFAEPAGRFGARVLDRAGFASHPKLRGLLTYGGTYPGAYYLRRGLFLPNEVGEVLQGQFAGANGPYFDPASYVDAETQPSPASPFGKVAAMEARIYMRDQLLRDSDWASMAHGLEVRVPLVDTTLLPEAIGALTSLNCTGGKRQLGLAPSTPLPDNIINRTKTGFETPVAEWLQSMSLDDAWRRLPLLADANCPWARRWAHIVAGMSGAVRPVPSSEVAAAAQ